MTQNVTSDDLHEHNNDFCVSKQKNIWKVITSVFNLSMFWTNWRSFDLTIVWKCNLRWPPWPQQWLLRIPRHVTYQMKGNNDFSIRPFNVLDQLEVIWHHHDQNVTSNDVMVRSNDLQLSKILKGRIMNSLPFIWYVTRHGLIFFGPQGGGGGVGYRSTEQKKLLILLNFLKIRTKSCLMAKKNHRNLNKRSQDPPPH